MSHVSLAVRGAFLDRPLPTTTDLWHGAVQAINVHVPPPPATPAAEDGFVVVTVTTASDGRPLPTTLPETLPETVDNNEQPPSPPPSPPPDAPPPSPPPSMVDQNNGECRLMGPFAILVQLGLGALAMLSLVFKRWRERPQRPVKIWFFDASKQVFGSVLVHMSNVFLSLLTSGRFSVMAAPSTATATVAASTASALLRLVRRADDEPYVPNPCSFYLLNLAIDTTVGIPILIGLLRLTTAAAARTAFGQPPASIQSGNYGHPPRAWWWLKQSLLYFCGLLGMKFVVFIIFVVFPWIAHVGDWALGWTEGNEQVQIVFVMMLFPLIMNAMQYYIIDGFIKEQPDAFVYESDASGHVGGHAGGSGHTAGDGRYDPLVDSSDELDHARDDRRRSRGSSPEIGDDEELDVLDDLDGLDGLDRVESGDNRDNRDKRAASFRESKKTAALTSSTSVASETNEYDPAVDGDSRTVLGSSTSSGKK